MNHRLKYARFSRLRSSAHVDTLQWNLPIGHATADAPRAAS